MKYYTISFPGEYGQHVVETWSEDQILSSYLKYWSLRMVEAKRPVEEMTRENCLYDWTAVHWAVETDQWGKTIENILAGAVQQEDDSVEYSESTLEKYEEFNKKRNYTYGDNNDN